MARFARLLAVTVIALVAFAPAIAAHADCTNPMDPDFGNCSPPPGGTAPPVKTAAPTPKATTKPAPKSTPAPTHHVYVPPPANNTTVDNSTPEPTPFEVQVTSPTPAATTVIETQTLPGTDEKTLEAQNASSSSGLIIGLLVGLVIGFLLGRASWGIKRRRRQQIFG
jgi:hypothetical protein